MGSRAQLPGVLGFLHAARAALLVALCLGTGVGVARAHPELDNAKRLASELELEASVAAFDRALASGTLTRAELIQLLSERAFVLHALHKKSELVDNFIWLSALDPNHRLDLRAPPDLTAIWTSVRDQGRGMLKITLEAIADEKGGVHARVTPTGTVPEGLKTSIVRRKEGGTFERKAGPELREPARAGQSVELYAEAKGIGDVIVAEAYSEESPLRIKVSQAEQQTQLPLAPVESGSDDSPSWARRHRGWIIGAAAVVAAGIIVGSVLIAKSGDDKSDQTNLKPMVQF